jgi:nitrate reductase gamma subunit
MRNLLLSLIAFGVLTLLALGIAASGPLTYALAVVAPYAVLAVFLAGFVRRIIQWARAPVPFPITTTCGQQASLPWIKAAPLESPAGTAGVLGRMALEVLLFRSLFRNTAAAIEQGKPVFRSAKWLWLFSLLFHGSLAVIVARHLRFFVEPVVPCVAALSALDGFFEIGVPTLYLSDIAMIAGLAFLFGRRVIGPRLRYLSLATDYFALLLIGAIVTTGLLMRHFFPADLLAVKTLALGWIAFRPAAPAGIGTFFHLHLVFVLTLLAWFPFSKLMHAGGLFLSPTRNLANDSRSRRHLNPWNYPVPVHTYPEYEDEFRDKMKLAGLPVEKE